MIHVGTMHRANAGWVGLLLRSTWEQARDMLRTVRPDDLNSSALTIAAYAVRHAVNDGDTPTWWNVADAADRHGLVPADDDAVFKAFLVDLSMLPLPPRGVIEGATTPGPVARSLAANLEWGVA